MEKSRKASLLQTNQLTVTTFEKGQVLTKATTCKLLKVYGA